MNIRCILSGLTALLLAHASLAQVNDPWVRFPDTSTELNGYKDLHGAVKIPAIYTNFGIADTFHHIMAVMDSNYVSYYLIKDGRKTGYDSVYTIDITPECESEGKIIFYDRKTDRAGFLDKDGQVAVPAVYNYASSFVNGMALAQRNARRKCYDRSNDTLHCEHLGWEGGETVLINSRNEILAENLDRSGLENINWYAMRVNDAEADTGMCTLIQASNGDVLAFPDYKKEFRQWYRTVFLPALYRGKLQELCFEEVSYYSPQTNEWLHPRREAFLQQFPAADIRQKFGPDSLKETEIYEEGLETYICNSTLYHPFFTACGQHFRERYPAFSVTVNTYMKRNPSFTEDVRSSLLPGNDRSPFHREYTLDYQESITFIRTAQGYRLLSVSFK